MSDSPASRHLLTATAVGTALQLAMIVAGHYSPAVARVFGPLGMTISLLVGLWYALRAGRPTLAASAGGGAVAGGVCALIGIAGSYLFGDVPATLLALGTLSSAVAGAIGGVAGHMVAARRTAGARG